MCSFFINIKDINQLLIDKEIQTTGLIGFFDKKFLDVYCYAPNEVFPIKIKVTHCSSEIPILGQVINIKGVVRKADSQSLYIESHSIEKSSKEEATLKGVLLSPLTKTQDNLAEMQFTHIADIDSSYIGKEIKTIGIVYYYNDKYITVYSYKSKNDKAKKIKIQNYFTYQIQVNSVLLVIGNVRFKQEDNFYIIPSKVDLITEAEAISKGFILHVIPEKPFVVTFDEEEDDEESKQISFFAKEPKDFKEFYTDEPDQLFGFLQQQANKEGFQIVKPCGLSSNDHAALRCNLHSKNKNPNLNTNCPFICNIQRVKNPKGGFRWHVSSIINIHNHLLHPLNFVHSILSEKKKSLIRSLYSSGVNYGIISNFIKLRYNIDISRNQIRSLCAASKRERTLEKIAETEELKEFMYSIDGVVRFDQYRDKYGYMHRKAVATFTRQELENLRDFGDFIAVDPTFATSSSHWSLIPLTVVGSDRDIRSAGIIFCSNTQEDRFRWILKILLTELPSKDKLQTICSDDDSGLNCAFRVLLNDDINDDFHTKVRRLNRVICFWHKISNFITFLNGLSLPEDKVAKYLEYFKKMGQSRDYDVAISCYKKLEGKSKLATYMIKNIKDDLKYFSKSMLQTFNCGYNTSSIAESTNSRLKNLFPDQRSLSLKEIRVALINAERLSSLSKQYICGIKPRKVKDQILISLIEKFNIAENIASAICNSIINAEDLSIRFIDDAQTQAEVIEKDPTFEDIYQEKFLVTMSGCSCKKQIQTGIPCKHFIKFLNEKNLNVINYIQVSERWTRTKPNERIEIKLVDEVQVEKSSFIPVTQMDRYISLKNLCLQIMNFASQSQNRYSAAKEKLDELYEQLQNIERIIDDVHPQPGRPHKSTNLANWNKIDPCKLCGKPHSTKRCPRRNEFLTYIPKDYINDSDKKYSCSLCGLKGHRIDKCFVKAAWLKAIKDGLLEPLG